MDPSLILKRLFGRKKGGGGWEGAGSPEGDSSASSGVATADSQDLKILNGIKARARAFPDYNTRKIATISSKLNDLDKEIFSVLPALVHLNLPELPGFISDNDLVPRLPMAARE